MIKKINKKRFGFTLVEMLVVISIIGILSAVLAGGYVNSQKSARDVARKLSLKSISDTLSVYYSDYGVYPHTPEIDINDLIDDQNQLTKNGVVYIKKMPKETKDGVAQIFYEVGRAPTYKSFRLYTNLENDEDGSCYKDSLGVIEDNLNGYSISSGCIYLVTSSNASATSLP